MVAREREASASLVAGVVNVTASRAGDPQAQTGACSLISAVVPSLKVCYLRSSECAGSGLAYAAIL